jgi:hypothetical protein
MDVQTCHLVYERFSLQIFEFVSKVKVPHKDRTYKKLLWLCGLWHYGHSVTVNVLPNMKIFAPLYKIKDNFTKKNFSFNYNNQEVRMRWSPHSANPVYAS